jgi:hypothetical protein
MLFTGAVIVLVFLAARSLQTGVACCIPAFFGLALAISNIAKNARGLRLCRRIRERKP